MNFSVWSANFTTTANERRLSPDSPGGFGPGEKGIGECRVHSPARCRHGRISRWAGCEGDAVRIIFANEKVRSDEPVANPDLTDSEAADHYRVMALDALVTIKLTAFRDKDLCIYET